MAHPYCCLLAVYYYRQLTQSEWANLDAQKIFDNFCIFHLYTEPCDISPPTELLIALKFCLNDTPYRKFLRMESENKPVTNL